MRIVRARFPSDTTHCPMVTSKSVCPTTVPDSGSGPYAHTQIMIIIIIIIIVATIIDTFYIALFSN